MQYFNPICSIEEQSQRFFKMNSCGDLHFIKIWARERECLTYYVKSSFNSFSISRYYFHFPKSVLIIVRRYTHLLWAAASPQVAVPTGTKWRISNWNLNALFFYWTFPAFYFFADFCEKGLNFSIKINGYRTFIWNAIVIVQF